MKTVAFIPARGGSKGLPRKNIKIFNKKPLIYWPINAALNSKYIDEVVVTTDDVEIADIAKSFGAYIPFIRPKDLAGDLSTTEETLQHALLKYEEIKGKIDIAIFMTCTDVFRKPEWIDDAIKKLMNNPNLESVFSGHKTHKNFWEKDNKSNWIRIKDSMKIYSSRQIREFIVREDTGIICASRAYLWRNGRRIGDKVDIILNDDSFTGLDIHSEEDFLIAEFAHKIRNKINLK